MRLLPLFIEERIEKKVRTNIIIIRKLNYKLKLFSSSTFSSNASKSVRSES